ncbi:MAG: hypothetical protein HYY36_03055 [Gammaproteobacteria bacterium]|nr:hypothetical protein [Gammaproteobacteria bacterium]
MRICFLGLVLLAAGSVSAEDYYGSGWSGEAEFALYYDDNVSRTGAAPGREEDFITQLGVGATYLQKLSRRAELAVGARVAWERFDEFGDLDNVELAAQGYLVFQPVPGFTQPWVEASARLSRLQFNDSDIRDGNLLQFGAHVGKRLRENVQVTGGYTYTRRYGEGEVFDLDDHSLELDVDWDASRRLSAYGSYAYHVGEVVSTAPPGLRIASAAEALSPDDVFETGIGPGCSNRRCAYRLDADSHVVIAGLEYALSERLSLDLSARWFHVDWGDNASYEGRLYRLSLYLQF